MECKHVLSQDIDQKIQSKSRNGPIDTFMIYKHVILFFNQMHLCESETKNYKHLVSKTIENSCVLIIYVVYYNKKYFPAAT